MFKGVSIATYCIYVYMGIYLQYVIQSKYNYISLYLKFHITIKMETAQKANIILRLFFNYFLSTPIFSGVGPNYSHPGEFGYKNFWYSTTCMIV